MLELSSLFHAGPAGSISAGSVTRQNRDISLAYNSCTYVGSAKKKRTKFRNFLVNRCEKL